MAYLKNTLITRPGYGTERGPFDGWTDTVGDILKGAANVFGAQQRAAGGQEALQQALAQQQAQAAASSGLDTTTVLLGLGAVGVAAYLILRKKKA